MAVRVVAGEAAAVHPEHTLEAERLLELTLDFLLGEIFIPVVAAKAFRGGHKGAGPVGVDAAPFQDERTHIHAHHLVGECPVKEYLLGDSVVEIRGELEAPAVEHEVVKVLLPIVAINRDSAVVARPGVVDGAFLKLDLGSIHANLVQPNRGGLDVGRHQQHLLEAQYRGDDPSIAFLHLLQFVPRCRLVRPGEHHPALSLPFSRQSHIHFSLLYAKILLFL